MRGDDSDSDEEDRGLRYRSTRRGNGIRRETRTQPRKKSCTRKQNQQGQKRTRTQMDAVKRIVRVAPEGVK